MELMTSQHTLFQQQDSLTKQQTTLSQDYSTTNTRLSTAIQEEDYETAHSLNTHLNHLSALQHSLEETTHKVKENLLGNDRKCNTQIKFKQGFLNSLYLFFKQSCQTQEMRHKGLVEEREAFEKEQSAVLEGERRKVKMLDADVKQQMFVVKEKEQQVMSTVQCVTSSFVSERELHCESIANVENEIQILLDQLKRKRQEKVRIFFNLFL
jgi:hypothetical protein